MFLEFSSEALWVWAFLCVSRTLLADSIHASSVIGISEGLLCSSLSVLLGEGVVSGSLHRLWVLEAHSFCSFGHCSHSLTLLCAKHVSVH